MIYIFGGASCGKSSYAEDLSEKLAKEENMKKIYLATMKINDAEDIERVKKHRYLRKDKDFKTVEFEPGFKNANEYRNNLVLLECISNLLANIMFTDSVIKDKNTAISEVLDEIHYIKENSKKLIIVGNDLSLAKGEFSKETKDYLSAMKTIHDILIEEASSVFEIIFGLENKIK